MVRYVVRRGLASLLVLAGVSVLIFTLVKLTPGDAARARLPATATQQQVDEMRRAMGLDRPVPTQYAY